MRKALISTAIFLLCAGIFSGSHVSSPILVEAKDTADTKVTISNFQFAPKVVRVKAGSAVTWEVKEGTHTVNADDDSFASSNLSAGQSFSHTFTKPGTYRYYCSFHGSKGGHEMAGTIIVSR